MPRRRSVVTRTDGEAGPVGAAIGGTPAGGDSGVSQMGLVGMLFTCRSWLPLYCSCSYERVTGV